MDVIDILCKWNLRELKPEEAISLIYNHFKPECLKRMKEYKELKKRKELIKKALQPLMVKK